MVVELCDRGAHLEARDRVSGFTAIMYASQVGHLGTVRELLARGANVNAADTKSAGYTALMLASCHGFMEVVRELLDWGAHINVTAPAPSCVPAGMATWVSHAYWCTEGQQRTQGTVWATLHGTWQMAPRGGH